MKKNKIVLKNGQQEKLLFYNIKRSLQSKSFKIKVIDRENLDIILPKKKFLNKVLLFAFCPEDFLEKNKVWIFKNIERLSKKSQKKVFQKDWKQNKEVFLKVAKQKIEEFNTFYNFKYKKVNIRDQKSRWGSCSQKGSLNFNYRVFLLPKKEMDYVIIHEICHLKEMNHSKKFWDLVEKKSPDYKKIKKDLDKYIF